MLSSSCCSRALSLCGVKFLSRLLTALNLLPSMATIASSNSPSSAAQQDELAADLADGFAVVAAEVGDRLEVRRQPPGEPDQLDVALRFALQPTARRHAVQVAVDVDLQQRRRVIRRPARLRRLAPARSPACARSSSSTKTSTARTGLSSAIQSSSRSGNRTLCVRSSPSMYRLMHRSSNAMPILYERSGSFHTPLYGHRPVCQVDLHVMPQRGTGCSLISGLVVQAEACGP